MAVDIAHRPSAAGPPPPAVGLPRRSAPAAPVAARSSSAWRAARLLRPGRGVRAAGRAATTRPGAPTRPAPAGPSAAHWLGTTQQQQDVLSQLLIGGRSTVLIGVRRRDDRDVLSVVIGVTAGYIGGLADDLLSMLANIFLVAARPAAPDRVIGPAGRRQRQPVLIGRSSASPAGRTAPGCCAPRRCPCAAGTTWSRRGSSASAAGASSSSRSCRTCCRSSPPRSCSPCSTRSAPTSPWPSSASSPRTLELGRDALLRPGRQRRAERTGGGSCRPALGVALLGTSLALLNFGIDEFINPRLRAGRACPGARRPNRDGRPPGRPGAARRGPRRVPVRRRGHGDRQPDAGDQAEHRCSRSAGCAWTTARARTRCTR